MKNCSKCGEPHTGKSGYCKPCAAQYWQNWRAKNPHYPKSKKYIPKDAEKVRYYRLKHKYGLTKEDFGRLMEGQDFKCAACETPLGDGVGNIHVDHCHVTGRIRAILCGGCNRALGLLNDDPNKVLRLAQYAFRVISPDSSLSSSLRTLREKRRRKRE